MRTGLTLVRLLALEVWVGGLIFSAFVLAPVAFSKLPSSHEAGLVVGAALRHLHRIGLVAGLVYVAAAAGGKKIGRWWAGPAMVVGMMVLTAVSQWMILPRMDVDRALAGGDAAAVNLRDSARVDFDRLHRLSVKVEGAVLVLGLGTTMLIALELTQSSSESRRFTGPLG